MSVARDIQEWTALGMDGEFKRRGELLVPASVVAAKPADIAAPAAVVAARPAPAVVPAPAEAVAAPARQPRLPQVDDRTVEQRRGREVESSDSLRDQLAEAREVIAVQREDARERRAQQAEHRIALADVDERAAAADRARRERARDAVEADALAELYRRATRSGARARIRAQIQGSAEMRALRVAKIRSVALLAGIPVLAAFAAWSTTGVQAGVVRLLDLTGDSPAWWASWAMEPALIAVVALIIIGRAVLRSSGGDTDWRATVAECTALGLSLALNIIGGWSGGWSGLLTALPHSIGPLGAAGTAFLIGVFDSYVSNARPWDGAPRLSELDLVPPSVAGSGDLLPGAINRGKRSTFGAGTDGLKDDVRKLLDDVQEAIEDGVLPPDPSGYAIYKHVQGGRGDKARASEVARLVAGWRPELRAV